MNKNSRFEAKIISVFSVLFLTLVSSISSGATTINVLDARIRWMPDGSSVTAGYLTLKNTSNKDIKLIKVEADFSKVVELHEMKMEGDRMQMRAMDSITIKAQQQVELKPGGTHLMFIDLKEKLTVGDKKNIVFTFDNKEVLKINIPVIDLNKK